MAEFIIKCTHCNADLTMDDEWIGQKVECPMCKTLVSVERPDGDNSVPVPGPDEIQTKCLYCGSFMIVKKDWIGQDVECPDCGKIFPVSVSVQVRASKAKVSNRTPVKKKEPDDLRAKLSKLPKAVYYASGVVLVLVILAVVIFSLPQSQDVTTPRAKQRNTANMDAESTQSESVQRNEREKEQQRIQKEKQLKAGIALVNGDFGFRFGDIPADGTKDSYRKTVKPSAVFARYVKYQVSCDLHGRIYEITAQTQPQSSADARKLYQEICKEIEGKYGAFAVRKTGQIGTENYASYKFGTEKTISVRELIAGQTGKHQKVVQIQYFHNKMDEAHKQEKYGRQ